MQRHLSLLSAFLRGSYSGKVPTCVDTLHKIKQFVQLNTLQICYFYKLIFFLFKLQNFHAIHV